MFGRLGDHVKRANCLNHMAIRLIRDGDRLDEAEAWLDKATELALRAGNDHERLHAELHRASLAQHRADHTTAQERFTALLPDFRRIGDLRCTVQCQLGLGRAAAAAGDHERARSHLLAGVETGIATHDQRLIGTGLLLLAETEHALGRPTRAAELLAAAPPVPDAPENTDLRETLRTNLGETAFAAALATGHRTPIAALLESLTIDQRDEAG